MVDFGLLVLLYLVQSIIYPSFAVVEGTRRESWHRIYLKRMTPFVGLLMCAQAGILSLQLLSDGATWTEVVSIALVAVCWYLSFRVSMPLHRLVANGEGDCDICRRLVLTNRPRLWGWSLVFLLGWI